MGGAWTGGKGVAVALALALLSPPVAAQSWVTAYGTELTEEVAAAAPTLDGGVFLAGRRDSPRELWRDVFAMKLDAGGQVEWQVSLEAPDDQWIHGITPTADGGVVITGSTQIGLDVHAAAWRLDAAGGLAWHVALGLTNANFSGRAVVRLGADGFLIAGEWWSSTGGASLPFLAHLAPDGTLAWGKLMVGAPGLSSALGADAVPGGEAIVAGTGGHLVRLDATGAITWQRAASMGQLLAVAATADGGLALAGGLADDVLIARMAPDGTIAHARTVGDGGQQHAVAVSEASNGDLLVAGTTDSVGDGDGYIVRMTDGGLAWQRAIGGPTPDTMTGIVELPSGAIVAAGSWDQWSGAYGFPDALAVSLGSDGRLDVSCPLAAAPPVTVVDVPLTLSPSSASLSNLSLRHVRPPVSVTAGGLDVRPQCTSGPCAVDDAEPDDACFGAPVAALGDTLERNACDDAEDWVTFEACAGVPIVLRTSDLQPQADTTLELWSGDCATLLAADDNGAGGLASRIDFVPSASGVHRLRLGQAAGATGPERGATLHLEGPACAPPTWIEEITIGAGPTTATDVAESAIGPVSCGRTDEGGVVRQLDPSGRIAWHRVLGAPGDRLDRLVVATDGSIVAVGTRGTAFPTQAWIVRLERDGAVRWQQALDLIGEGLEGRAVDESDDGSLLLAADGQRPSGGVVAGLLGDGTLAWATRISMPLVRLRGVTALPAGAGVVVAGRTASPVSGSPHSLVARLNTDGSLAWANEIVFSDDLGARATDAITTTEGTVMIAGTGYSLWPTSAWLAEIDPADGSVVQRCSLRRYAWSFEGVSVRQVADGFLVADLFAVSDPRPGGGLCKLSRDLRLDWATSLHDPTDWVLGARLAASPQGGVRIAFDEPNWLVSTDMFGRVRGDCNVSGRLRTPVGLPDVQVVPSPATFASTSLAAVAWLDPGRSNATLLAEQCASAGCQALDVTAPRSSTTIACPGDTLAFEADATGHADLVVEWDFDYDGAAFDVEAAGIVVSHAFPSQGTFTIAVRASDTTCPTTGPRELVRTIDVIVGVAPVTITQGCLGNDAILDAGPGYVTYLWSTSETTQVPAT